jgi:DNA-binding MarR family transcriptional regulator
VLVQLTPAGRDAVDAAMADLLAHERKLLGTISERDQAKIARVLRELVRPFDLEKH